MTEHTIGTQEEWLRVAAPFWLVLALIGGLAWVVAAGEAWDMGAGPGTMGMTFPFFLGMWVAMMAAMMLPAIGPQAAGGWVADTRTRSAGRLPGVLAFGAGFLVPWAAYGAVAFLVLLGVGSLVESSPEAARWLGVGIVAVAGLYQFTPMKRRALDHCRMALHASGFGSLAGDLRAGVVDGAVCVGCCWALMATLISAGVMNLAAMVGLAAVIFGEKVLPRPRLVAGIAGAALLVLAIAAAIDPSLLSGVVPDDMPMRMSE
jgi:predicted metal-binding membrane protein